VLNRGQAVGTAERGVVNAGALQDLMAGGRISPSWNRGWAKLSDTLSTGGPTLLEFDGTKQVTPPCVPYSFGLSGWSLLIK